MARGPKKHLKRLNAPKHWMLGKLGGIYAPRPSTGPHKMRECLPLSLILRNRLKYALTRRETIILIMRRLVEVDGKVRTDINYPAGFMDTVTIAKTNERFRLLYDVKGRFVLHVITPEEAKFKLGRVQQVSTAKKASIGRNPFQTGQMAAIPYLVTHDGRTIRYPDPLIKVHDVVKIDLATGKITEYLKFDVGVTCMVTRGANTGRIGTITKTEKHPGSFDIVHLRDKRSADFATRILNVFVIGDAAKTWVTIPRARGLKESIIEERAETERRKESRKK